MKRLPIKKFILAAIAIVMLYFYFSNASWLAQTLGSGPVLMAHRGLSQDFDRTGLTNDTCTASRMLPTPHAYLENTIASMQAAFDYGADIVELDVHPTVDNRFAVFHDWTVDCRT
ncbi:MAG: glycerophosphodiester phosphodiesterase, partial [Leptolyngbya sp. SIO1D8]|nr:glycerophosphodiester phosphodiesterase [Leptolyngbya sp. SIO1D8]